MVLLVFFSRTLELCRGGLRLFVLESDLIADQPQLLLQHLVEVGDLVGREDEELHEDQAQVEQAEQGLTRRAFVSVAELVQKEAVASGCLLAGEDHVGGVDHHFEDEELVSRQLLHEQLAQVFHNVAEAFQVEGLLDSEVTELTLQRQPRFEPPAQTRAVNVGHAALAVARLNQGTASAEAYATLLLG